MASLLDFERYGADLQKQLIRRIGYTNGLHKIRRFLRVVQYLHPIMPTSAALLAQVVIRQENDREENSDRQLKGSKYAVGIIDVAGALGLLERFGRKIALSSEGYASYALCESDACISVLDAFLLERVIEADGEYVLNILRIVGEGTHDVIPIGEMLVKRFKALLRFKQEWVRENVQARHVQRIIDALLTDAMRTLDKATSGSSPSGQTSTDFFLKHIVKPRLEWLQDLGCIEESRGELSLAKKGSGLLNEIRKTSGWRDFGIYLPLNCWLTSQLELPSMYADSQSRDFGWRLVAAAAVDPQDGELIHLNAERLLCRIKEIYPFVKLATFNEADALSIYHVLAAHEANDGRTLPEAEFNAALTKLVNDFPSEVFRLSKRRGRGMYIALKRSA